MLVLFILLSVLIGIGTIPFQPSYKKFDLVDLFVPYYKNEKFIYYQIFYSIFLFGIIFIAICTFNILVILKLMEHRETGNKYKKDSIYIANSIFVFISLTFAEASFVCRLIVAHYQSKLLFYLCIFLYNLAFDLTSIGDFYFLIFTSNELRHRIRNFFRFSKKKAKVDAKVVRLV
uniref:Serpentine receptor class gamma n=1 Tax=Strongyloides venezuelensis TaxID=75913 RepID=A0A0K0FJH9_STRVS